MPHCLHIAHPSDKKIHGFAAAVTTFIANHAAPALGPDWIVRTKVFDARDSINATDYVAEILTAPGPLLVVRPVQTNTLVELTTRLEGRQLVVVSEVYDVATLDEAVRELKTQFDAGEPLIPLRRAVALMLLRKLDRERMWGGNAKGYMWYDWIRKGRGIDEIYHEHVGDLVFLLHQHDYLISKPSSSKKKYALNPAKRVDIGDILRNRKFPDIIERVFARHGQTTSSRVLAILDDCD